MTNEERFLLCKNLSSRVRGFLLNRQVVFIEIEDFCWTVKCILKNRQVHSQEPSSAFVPSHWTSTSIVVQQLCQWLSYSCESHKNAVLSWKHCYFVCKTLNIRDLCDKISVISLSRRVEKKKNLNIFSRKFKLYLANWQVDVTFAVENDRLSASRSCFTPYYRNLLEICGQNGSAKFGLEG